MAIWNSDIFQKNPIITEIIFRFMMKSKLGKKIIDKIISDSSYNSIFKMFPFSTDPIYENIDIIAQDNSGKKHLTNNGNIWLSCNSPKNEYLFVEIIL